MDPLFHFQGPFSGGISQVGEDPVTDVLAFSNIEQLLVLIEKIIGSALLWKILNIINCQIIIQVFITSCWL